MSNTNFVDQTTIIVADWLNDVNDTVYEVLGNGTSVPVSKDDVRDNLNVPQRDGADATGTWPINVTGSASSLSGTVMVTNGGTGATTASDAFDALKQPATETSSGVLEIATQAEAEAGAIDTAMMTPLKAEQHMMANALGWGQTWQNMTASRTIGGTYTNNTGRPIYISIRPLATSPTTNTAVLLTIAGVQVAAMTTAESNGVAWGTLSTTLGGIVPNGSAYQINNLSGTHTVAYWAELR